MKKILILSPDYYPSKGGVEYFVFNLANYLKKKKYKVNVFSGTRINKLNKEKKYKINTILIKKFLTYKIFGLDFPKNLISYFKLYKDIKKNNVIILNDIKFFFFSTLLFSYLLKKKNYTCFSWFILS